MYLVDHRKYLALHAMTANDLKTKIVTEVNPR